VCVCVLVAVLGIHLEFLLYAVLIWSFARVYGVRTELCAERETGIVDDARDGIIHHSSIIGDSSAIRTRRKAFHCATGSKLTAFLELESAVRS
jgi:hypothetical protein